MCNYVNIYKNNRNMLIHEYLQRKIRLYYHMNIYADNENI